ncbi:MAG TPA: condensation domain-containing protein, partial [Candidatus Deferrimicrobium sp.]|nr:condensation domain-containing protein [Candidatus Deferrimicrobium sp.]
QLGGHSLKATVLVSRIHKNFNVQVAFKEIFQNPTVRSLSTYLKDMSGNRYAAMEPVEEKEYYALSSGQKRLYILQQMELESTAYNMPQEFHLIGPDIEKLETIFKKLIERHESLRTSFQMINGEPVQRIYDHVEFEIEHAMNFVRPFDLAKAPLLRVGLSRETENEYMMMVDMHHIISDGVSQGILIADFFTLYNGDSLEPVRIQYKDFSQWQNSEKEKEKIKKQEAYWLNIFADEVPVLNIPTDYPRPAVQSFSGRSFGFELEPGMYVGLKNMAAAKGGTLYMVLLAIYNVLLAKLSNREDIVIGTTTAGRRHADLENTIGMFVNTLALRNYPEGHKDFEGFLVEVKERTLEAFENQEYPFEDLVEKVVLKRDVSRNPIFDTMFTLHQENRVETSQLDIKPYEIESGIAKFDLILTCTESEEKLSFSFDYGIKLFKEETIQRFTTYFKQVVSAIIENRNRQLSQVEIITPEEKKQLLYEFNDLTPRFPGEKNICRLFEEQVARTPDAVSLHYMSHITYFELNKKSELLAQRLIDEGVRPGLIVGLMAERSPEMIAGILGTWKSGCAYAPLNPKAPAARNDYMLAECGAGFLLTNTEIRRLETHAHAQSTIELAYVIFTSGSTGNPKGVPITHANLSPLLHWGYGHLGIGVHERTIQNLSYYFDWSVWEIFITLTTGASLYIVPEDMLLDAEAGVDFINRHGVSVLHITPTQYRYLVKASKAPDSLKYLFIGAEKLTYDLAARSLASVSGACRVFNMYGPTEATIISAVLEINRESLESFVSLGSMPIGKAAGNSFHFILDKYNNICPVNIAGELYIGGDGVSMGYLNNPELTLEKFSIFHHSSFIIHHSNLY